MNRHCAAANSRVYTRTKLVQNKHEHPHEAGTEQKRTQHEVGTERTRYQHEVGTERLEISTKLVLNSYDILCTKLILNGLSLHEVGMENISICTKHHTSVSLHNQTNTTIEVTSAL